MQDSLTVSLNTGQRGNVTLVSTSTTLVCTGLHFREEINEMWWRPWCGRGFYRFLRAGSTTRNFGRTLFLSCHFPQRNFKRPLSAARNQENDSLLNGNLCSLLAHSLYFSLPFSPVVVIFPLFFPLLREVYTFWLKHAFNSREGKRQSFTIEYCGRWLRGVLRKWVLTVVTTSKSWLPRPRMILNLDYSGSQREKTTRKRRMMRRKWLASSFKGAKTAHAHTILLRRVSAEDRRFSKSFWW